MSTTKALDFTSAWPHTEASEHVGEFRLRVRLTEHGQWVGSIRCGEFVNLFFDSREEAEIGLAEFFRGAIQEAMQEMEGGGE